MKFYSVQLFPLHSNLTFESSRLELGPTHDPVDSELLQLLLPEVARQLSTISLYSLPDLVQTVSKKKYECLVVTLTDCVLLEDLVSLI